MSVPQENKIEQIVNEDKPYYKDVFREIIDNLDEPKLNELVEMIESQKVLIKLGDQERKKYNQRMREMRTVMTNKLKDEMKEFVKKQKMMYKNQYTENEDEEDEEFEEEEVPVKNKRSSQKKLKKN